MPATPRETPLALVQLAKARITRDVYFRVYEVTQHVINNGMPELMLMSDKHKLRLLIARRIAVQTIAKMRAEGKVSGTRGLLKYRLHPDIRLKKSPAYR